jgi:opacity protein-like surface antigen
MIRTLLLASTAGLALLVALPPAQAADLSAPRPAAPAIVTGPSWTGFHLGVHGGVVFDNMGYKVDNTFFGGDITKYRFGATDYVFGLHGGFDYQFGSRFVVGAEVAYDWHDHDYNVFASGGFPTLLKSQLSWSVSGRAGYLVTPETLLYARLSYANVKVESEEGFFGIAKKSMGAWGIGVGAETFLFGNWTGRVEANYYQASSEFTNADLESVKPRYLTVMAGLSYRFNVLGESRRPVAPAPNINWNGFYAGVDGSYNLGNMHLDVNVPGTTVGPYAGQSFGAGAFVGYNFVFASSYLVGVEAGGTYLNAKFDDPEQNAFFPMGTTLFGKIKGLYSASARVGYLATPATLLYLKGGYAGMVTEANPDFFALSGGGTKTLSAYQLGAGIESALTDNITLRVEGLYTKATDSITAINSQPAQNTLKPSLLSGKIGIAYHF